MIRIENDCCGCAVPAYPCLGDSCKLRNNPHYYCDQCGEEDTLYESYNGKQLCRECLIDEIFSSGDYPIVEGSDCY